MSNDFYRAFEEKFRGSRDLIKLRLQAYQPFIEPLKQLYPAPQVIDLGCGRGEWLEILRELGFSAVGIDLDDHMLALCRERGLNVRTGDALSALKEVPDSSQSIVSGFHFAEHLKFADLQIVIQEALRVLRPGGLLILETPNPENVMVASTTFYLDPTHQRPIPFQLLAFLVEYQGFKRVVKVGLNEEKQKLKNISAFDLLRGVSPDYAIIAQKDAPTAQLELFNGVFVLNIGVDLNSLATKYEESYFNREQRLLRVEKMLQQIKWPINFLIQLKTWYKRLTGSKNDL